MNEIEAVNKKIQDIFKRHGIKPVQGEEGFWNAVGQVKDAKDRQRLNRLADHWAVAMTFNLERGR